MSIRSGGFQCGACAHFIPWIASPAGVASCAAFPGGIPEEILDDRFDHRRPYPGDHGVRWEPERPGIVNPIDAHAALSTESSEDER